MSQTKTRVTVDLNAADYARLEALEAANGSSSKADVLRDAIRVYDFLYGCAQRGAKFSVTAEDGTTETVLLVALLP